jgi:hypothetical protein
MYWYCHVVLQLELTTADITPIGHAQPFPLPLPLPLPLTLSLQLNCHTSTESTAAAAAKHLVSTILQLLFPCHWCCCCHEFQFDLACHQAKPIIGAIPRPLMAPFWFALNSES